METSNPLLKRESAFASSWSRGDTMTLQGVINKTGILLLLCMGSAAFAWTHPALRGPLMLVGLIGGFIACLVGIFKPTTSPVAAPVYALLEGLALGAISQVMQQRYPGIVVNAMLLTFGVLGLMLMLYTSRTIRVTDRLVKGVFAATAAVALVYLVDIVMNMFGARMPLIHETGWLGIGISLVIVGIAAFNLLIDFAVVEDNVNRSSPRYMEWYCGMALLVTLVWLYLELLRLLAKLRGRN
ncbi:MAG: Bax inhibitor-1/YccA family protein [Verrucomicrobiota bacterium]